MIYISHILADVIELADDIAVLRDGELVASRPEGATSTSRGMITLMVGRPIEQLYPPRHSAPQPIASSSRPGAFGDRHHQGYQLSASTPAKCSASSA